MNYERVKSNGYYALYIPDHPNAFGRGYVYEHRYLIEKKIGRYLTKEEEVHHIDENKLNNDLSNLKLCASKEEHKAEHRKANSNLQKIGEENITILCACGCGKTFKKFDEAGRPRKYGRGCRDEVKVKREKLQEMTVCACGCNEKMTKRNKHGRIRNFISGHNMKNEFSKTDLAKKCNLSYATLMNYFKGKKIKDKTVKLIENTIKENYGIQYLR